jgi:ATP sulfurylase
LTFEILGFSTRGKVHRAHGKLVIAGKKEVDKVA